MTSEFIGCITPATIVGRLPSLRRVPMDIRIEADQPLPPSGGEANPAPMTGAAYSCGHDGRHTQGINTSALSEELMRTSDPKAETLIRADLIRAAAWRRHCFAGDG